MHFISVIICTHNPNLNYLKRVLISLKEQKFRIDNWELLIVDNVSEKTVENLVDLSWHPNGRHIREEKLGLTSARIRGIAESKGDLLVFVDDDNCLKENYLNVLLEAFESMSLLGVLGAGRIIPEFETEPTSTEVPFLRSLAIRNEVKAHFSNEVHYHKGIPYGAGMCIRRSIAKTYVDTCATSQVAVSLDRNGSDLLSGGDIDLALHACNKGYLAGVLPELELIHIIPKTRLDHGYLIKIAAGHAASSYLLSKIWNFKQYPENPLIKWGRHWKNRIKAKGLARKILVAEYRAEKEASYKWKALTSQNT
jgi:GT2 family glycosyltransferase